MRKFLTGLNHVLEQVDEIGFLKDLCLAKGLVGKLFAATVVMFSQTCGSIGSELGHTGVFAVSLGLRRAAFDTRDVSIGNGNFLAVVGGVLAALGVVGEPFRVDDQRSIGGIGQRTGDGFGCK